MCSPRIESRVGLGRWLLGESFSESHLSLTCYQHLARFLAQFFASFKVDLTTILAERCTNAADGKIYCRAGQARTIAAGDIYELEHKYFQPHGAGGRGNPAILTSLFAFVVIIVVVAKCRGVTAAGPLVMHCDVGRVDFLSFFSFDAVFRFYLACFPLRNDRPRVTIGARCVLAYACGASCLSSSCLIPSRRCFDVGPAVISAQLP